MGVVSKQTIELSTGKKVTVDVSTMTVIEWRGFFDATVDNDVSDTVLARLAGMTLEELGALFFLDYRHVWQAVMDTANNPLDDPNSASESTSD